MVYRPWIKFCMIGVVWHTANIHQDSTSIRNMQVVSSNRVHSTHSCEANKQNVGFSNRFFVYQMTTIFFCKDPCMHTRARAVNVVVEAYLIIVQLGLDFKLNTKISLDTTHPPPTHPPPTIHPPQTFRSLPGLPGGWDLVCWLYSQI